MKKWYTSRTVLVALAQFVVASIAAIVVDNPDANAVSLLLAAKSAIDLYLRANTDKGIKI